MDVQHAVESLTACLGYGNFKCSNVLGDMVNITRKILNTETEAMNFFTNELNQFVENKELHYIQIYNTDKTGLFWHSLTRNIQASYCLWLVIVEKSKKIKGTDHEQTAFEQVCLVYTGALKRLVSLCLQS